MNAGHAHADLLSLTASAGGRHLLVDGGTFSYPGPERNAFRGAAAHNTLLVDGEGSSVPSADAFQWAVVADGRALAWEATEASAYFEGTHDGFARLGDGVAHRRAVLLLPGLGWVVRDRVDARGEHTVRVHWHLAPGLAAAADGPGIATRVVDAEGRPALTLAAYTADGPARLRTEPAWVSPRYGARHAAIRVVHERRLAGAQEIVTLVLPAAAGAAPAAADVVAALADLLASGAATPPGTRQAAQEILAFVRAAAGRTGRGAATADGRL
jgi:hypothetical protein